MVVEDIPMRHPRETLQSTLIAVGIAVIFIATAFLLAGCASSPGNPGIAPAGIGDPLQSMSDADSDRGSRCWPFSGAFYEFVACQRANGTLRSFLDCQVTWRVRYFVRFNQMPCDEAPTVEESYVFRMVTNDLDRDRDLNDAQRLAIRTTMFEGKVNCGR
jgi:hypothetical protein